MSWESSVYKSWRLKEPEGSKYAEETWILYCNQRRKEKHSSLPKQSQLHRGSERKSMMKIEESRHFYNRKTQWQIDWYIVFFFSFFCCSLKKEWWKHNPLPLLPLQEAWLGFFFFPLELSNLWPSVQWTFVWMWGICRWQRTESRSQAVLFQGKQDIRGNCSGWNKGSSKVLWVSSAQNVVKTPRAAALFSRRRNGRHTDHWG